MTISSLARLFRKITSAAVLAFAIPTLAAAQATVKPNVGDTCQLTNTLSSCQTLAKAKLGNPQGLFVAVAGSDTDLVGAAHGQSSKSAAERIALANCKAIGGKSCKILRSEQNTCVALAIAVVDIQGFNLSMTSTGDGANKDRSAAGAQAVSACSQSGGKECRLRVAACAADSPAYSSPLPVPSGGQPGSVDSNWVGAWELDPYGPGNGRWVMQVSANGTYEVHSEALDGTPSSIGTFTAKSGRYTLHATNLTWDDSGTYSLQSESMVATGKLGTGTWHKIARDDE